MKLSVCVGSSCHLKGSYLVIEALKKEIATRGLEEKIELTASFCLGRCSEGVSMKMGEEFILGANADNVAEIFAKKILPKVK